MCLCSDAHTCLLHVERSLAHQLHVRRGHVLPADNEPITIARARQRPGIAHRSKFLVLMCSAMSTAILFCVDRAYVRAPTCPRTAT